ncbi:MAG: recombinase family protein [Fulvivirga sp.]|uniref:recombinase family protein n=1 Tax=Ekhidna sp. TaxID=2608089 RepID=UPI002BC68C51|nr:recombinase family protein [Fulvivirga sp.]
MKSIIYTRVSSNDQSTQRQLDDMKSIKGFDVDKVFSEKISAFTKTSDERPGLQQAVSYIRKHSIKCIMISEVSRLGRNTVDVLNLLEQLKKQSVAVYIHNLGTTINTKDQAGEIFTKLIVTIMADLARLESEQLSYRIKSGIRSRKAKGLTTGRKIGSKESIEKFLAKHQDIQRFLSKGYSSREIQKLCNCSPNTIKKVKDNLNQI